MTVRIYAGAVILAAAMVGVSLAMTASGRPIAGIVVGTIATLLTLAPLLWLLKETRR